MTSPPIPNKSKTFENSKKVKKSLTILFCYNDVDVLRCWRQKIMLVTFQSVTNVGDWYLMFMSNSWYWWRDFLPTFSTCHQHIWSPTFVPNIDVTDLINMEFSSMVPIGKQASLSLQSINVGYARFRLGSKTKLR